METAEEKNKEKLENGSLSKKYLIGTVFFVLVFALIALYCNREKNFSAEKEFYFPNASISGELTLEESNKMKNSQSQDWWLNSGGIMNISEKEFSTNLGSLQKNSIWRKIYNKNNPRDTDQGYYPQNIFRLVTKSQWQNYSQSMYFYIEKINLSESEYRNESNGILFFNRYQDGDNLYYTGLRVDGDVVIKKKIMDKYYTLAEKPYFSKEKKYDRVENPNLIPINKWIGIKSELKNRGNNSVEVNLYLDLEGDGKWKKILEAEDEGNKYGKEPFLEKGFSGIRTDFMDVKFRDYKIMEEEYFL